MLLLTVVAVTWQSHLTSDCTGSFHFLSFEDGILAPSPAVRTCSTYELEVLK